MHKIASSFPEAYDLQYQLENLMIDVQVSHKKWINLRPNVIVANQKNN